MLAGFGREKIRTGILMKRLTYESGYALLTALVFLLILTTLGVVSMQSSTLEYRMGTNTAFYEIALQGSDGGRRATALLIDEHIFERGWTGVSRPNGMTVIDKDNANGADMLFLPGTSDANQSQEADNENLQVNTTLLQDIDYNQGQLAADIAVVQVATVTNQGAGTAQLSGYQGLGKSVSTGGFSTYYEVRSEGNSRGDAKAITASNYRYVPR